MDVLIGAAVLIVLTITVLSGITYLMLLPGVRRVLHEVMETHFGSDSTAGVSHGAIHTLVRDVQVIKRRAFYLHGMTYHLMRIAALQEAALNAQGKVDVHSVLGGIEPAIDRLRSLNRREAEGPLRDEEEQERQFLSQWVNEQRKLADGLPWDEFDDALRAWDRARGTEGRFFDSE